MSLGEMSFGEKLFGEMSFRVILGKSHLGKRRSGNCRGTEASHSLKWLGQIFSSHCDRIDQTAFT
jgi:hypothetical protein